MSNPNLEGSKRYIPLVVSPEGKVTIHFRDYDPALRFRHEVRLGQGRDAVANDIGGKLREITLRSEFQLKDGALDVAGVLGLGYLEQQRIREIAEQRDTTIERVLRELVVNGLGDF